MGLVCARTRRVRIGVADQVKKNSGHRRARSLRLDNAMGKR